MTTLTLGEKTNVEDGVYFVVREWDTKARLFKDVPGLHSTECQARDVRDRMMAGTTRTARYTVHQGYVTTRQELRY